MGSLVRSAGFDRLARKKQLGISRPDHQDSPAPAQLSRELRVPQLLAIGIGTTIGAGIFILIGTVAKERTGPALPLSFAIAGVAAALSAFSYAELASRLPSAGSAYHYAYTCLGEGLAWFVGWSLILEYTVSGATVARGVSPNLALFFGEDLPFWLVRRNIPGTGILADPFAGFLIVMVTILLCTGIKQSAAVQVVMTVILVLVLLFVDVVGLWIGIKEGWRGYELKTGYTPFGVSGVLGGAAMLFFSYVGFDAVATTAEEVKNPHVDLPIGIGLALLVCASLYMSVSAVVVGIVPYFLLNTDTPISTAFSQNGLPWATYIVALGALTAMLTTLLGCSLPQPRILMAMSRDGLLPQFFSIIHKSTLVPVNGAVTTGTIAVFVSVFMDISQLSEMVSVGTLMAFTSVALCVLIIRYSPPHSAVHLPVSISVETTNTPPTTSNDVDISNENEEREEPEENDAPEGCSIDLKNPLLDTEEIYATKGKQGVAGWSICIFVLGSLILSLFLSMAIFPRWLQIIGGTIGGLLFAGGVIVLSMTKQDESHRTFGNPGGFHCPLVPWLPAASVFVNVYLLVNVGYGIEVAIQLEFFLCRVISAATWIRVSELLRVEAFSTLLRYHTIGFRHLFEYLFTENWTQHQHGAVCPELYKTTLKIRPFLRTVADLADLVTEITSYKYFLTTGPWQSASAALDKGFLPVVTSITQPIVAAAAACDTTKSDRDAANEFFDILTEDLVDNSRGGLRRLPHGGLRGLLQTLSSTTDGRELIWSADCLGIEDVQYMLLEYSQEYHVSFSSKLTSPDGAVGRVSKSILGLTGGHKGMTVSCCEYLTCNGILTAEEWDRHLYRHTLSNISSYSEGTKQVILECVQSGSGSTFVRGLWPLRPAIDDGVLQVSGDCMELSPSLLLSAILEDCSLALETLPCEADSFNEAVQLAFTYIEARLFDGTRMHLAKRIPIGAEVCIGQRLHKIEMHYVYFVVGPYDLEEVKSTIKLENAKKRSGVLSNWKRLMTIRVVFVLCKAFSLIEMYQDHFQAKEESSNSLFSSLLTKRLPRKLIATLLIPSITTAAGATAIAVVTSGRSIAINHCEVDDVLSTSSPWSGIMAILDARRVFNPMEKHSSVSWMTLKLGYSMSFRSSS
ncbi:hypothetical protein SELMODRAFT_414183 [Selaginella moellendorffii]|uniref:Uncharacterized protein CAT2-2 n=1 Tax=Selaginella moellendorffii TaxID=88036 RepID=D8RRX4_SELML|nr:hypothetical protein SELMODRAFT_414183 [Selaginella moellendorffii]